VKSVIWERRIGQNARSLQNQKKRKPFQKRKRTEEKEGIGKNLGKGGVIDMEEKKSLT